jgi:hypothetical protein
MAWGERKKTQEQIEAEIQACETQLRHSNFEAWIGAGCNNNRFTQERLNDLDVLENRHQALLAEKKRSKTKRRWPW